jgi:hypothetical protein
LQRRELRLQRQESERQRIQLEKSAEAQAKAERALNRQADYLYLSAYLSALDSLIQSFLRGQSNEDGRQARNIRDTLQSIVDELAPNIPYVAKRTAQLAHREVDNLTIFAIGIENINKRFSVQWRAMGISEHGRNLNSALECVTRLRDHVLLMASEMASEMTIRNLGTGPITIALSHIEDLLALLTNPPTGMPPAQFFDDIWTKGYQVEGELDSLANLIRERTRQIEAGVK